MSLRAVAVSASTSAWVRFCSIARRRSACDEPFSDPCVPATALAAISNAAATAASIASERLARAVRPVRWLFTMYPLVDSGWRRMGHGEPQMQSQQFGIFVALGRRYGRAVATACDRGRCRERLGRLSESSLDCESLQQEAIAELRAVVGFDRWCWPLSDPEALVPLAGAAEHDYGPAVGRSLELEYSGGDFATMGALARRANPVGSLSAETRGDLARSPRWDEVLRPVGIGDEAVVACRDALGCWGWIKTYRDGDDSFFAPD